jgi:hypothetical protein
MLKYQKIKAFRTLFCMVHRWFDSFEIRNFLSKRTTNIRKLLQWTSEYWSGIQIMKNCPKIKWSNFQMLEKKMSAIFMLSYYALQTNISGSQIFFAIFTIWKPEEDLSGDLRVQVIGCSVFRCSIVLQWTFNI